MTRANPNQHTRAATDIDQHVGRQIRAIRQLYRISQETLAARLGITFQQVQKYESGRNRVSASRLWQMALILDCDPNAFFNGLPRPA